ncbi:MAG: hypothetical protein ACRCWS_03525 [Propionibacteriaceae bacterium]
MVLAATVNHDFQQPSMSYRGLLCILLLLITNSGCRATTSPQTLQHWVAAVVQARHDPAACRELMTDSLGYVCGNIAQLAELSISANGEDHIEISAKVGAEITAAHYDAIEVQLHQGKALTFGGFRPLWLLEPVRMVTFPRGVVVAGEQVDGPETIANVAAGAMAKLEGARLGPLVADSGPVVIVVPATKNSWQLALPESAPTLATTAFAWPFGRTSDVAVHVVMAPPQRGAKLDDVLTHELVHVLTKSCQWTTAWVSEGLAHYLAEGPTTPARAAALRQQVQAQGLPQGLPTNEQIKQATTMVPYDQAAVAVEVLIDHVGWDQARDILLHWATGQAGSVTLAQEQQWYIEALTEIAR